MRKAMTQQKTDVQIQLDGFDDEYRAVNFLFKEFPVKTDEPELEGKKQQKDHFADHFEEIAELIQGSRLNKEECILMVCDKFPNVSKTSIRAFFKVCVNKDKMDKEDIQRVLSKQKNVVVPEGSKKKVMTFNRLSINSEALEQNFKIQASKQKL